MLCPQNPLVLISRYAETVSDPVLTDTQAGNLQSLYIPLKCTSQEVIPLSSN